jgi:uncharacterized membrane protein YdbT with pleckstrin-like domain
MKYIDKVVGSDEHIIYRGTLHWIIYAPTVVALMTGMILTIFGGFGPDEPNNFLGPLGILVLFFTLVAWIEAWLKRLTTEIAVTTRRVIVKYGLIRRSTMELSGRKIESVLIDQTIFGRLLDYGTVITRGTGSGLEPIVCVKAPLQLREAVGTLQESMSKS